MVSYLVRVSDTLTHKALDDDPTMAFIVLWEAAITGDTYEQSKLTMKELHRFSIPISVVHSFIILGDLLLLKPIWTDAMLAYKWRGDEEDVGTWRTFRTMFSYKVIPSVKLAGFHN